MAPARETQAALMVYSRFGGRIPLWVRRNKNALPLADGLRHRRGV
jgi:hypothetical protein